MWKPRDHTEIGNLLLHDLCQEVPTMHGNTLRLFYTKEIALLLLFTFLVILVILQTILLFQYGFESAGLDKPP